MSLQVNSYIVHEGVLLLICADQLGQLAIHYNHFTLNSLVGFCKGNLGAL